MAISIHSALPSFKDKTTRHYYLTGIVLLMVLLLIIARLYLNVWLENYVNRSLNNIPGYQGSIESIDIDLYRGAYRIHQLKIYKKTGRIPVPFIDIETTDLSIQWGALLHGRIVSNADLQKPVLNFAVNPTGNTVQTGADVDWSKPIKDLMPVDINLVTFSQGKLTYQDFSSNPKINLSIQRMSGEIRNLRNVEAVSGALPSEVSINGESIGGGKLAIHGKLNILKPIPDMDLETKLEKVNLKALSNYTQAYAAFDIEKGNLDVYSELTVKSGRVSGYIKPIATGISIIDLRHTNPVKLVWETLVGAVIEIFTNQPRDQFATRIELEGNLNNIETNIWSTLGGIIHNAFIKAFERGIDHQSQ